MTKSIKCDSKVLLPGGTTYAVMFEENSGPPRIKLVLIPATPATAALFTISSIYTLTVT